MGPYYHGNETAAPDPDEIRIVVQLRAVSRPNAGSAAGAQGTNWQSRFDDASFQSIDTICTRLRSRADRLSERCARKVQSGAIVNSVTWLHLRIRDRAMVNSSSLLAAAVVRAGGRIDQREVLTQSFDSSVRVGQPAIEPTDHACADATQHDPIGPRIAQDHVQPMSSPYGKQIRRAPATDIDDILFADERRQFRGSRWASREER